MSPLIFQMMPARFGIFASLLVSVSTLAACAAPPTAASPAPVSSASTEANVSAAPKSVPEAATLTVFAAASLQDAFGEIGKNFEAAQAGTTVAFNFAGSQQLAQQLSQGAPADVFASANNTQMNAAVTAGRVVSGTAQTFVRNRLVVVVPTNNPAQLKTLQDLAKPGLKLVLAAQAVPVGQYALDFLGKATADPAFGSTYSQTMLANVVSYEDNVRAVLTKVALGEADAGIIYSSDVTPEVAGQVTQLPIPDVLNTLATYPIATVQDSQQADLAAKFVAYVLSDEGQKVLAQHGFMPIN